MITLDYSNLTKIAKQHGLSKKEINSQSKKLAGFLKKIQKRDQGFYKIVDNKKVIDKINSFAKKIKNRYSDIVVLGIGGSALGAICLRDALLPSFKNISPRLHVIDNIDPDLIAELENALNYSKTLFIVISKSGDTTETFTQYLYFRKKAKNFIFITDSKKGQLREIAKKENIPAFEIPENIGGRFSVLTAVGLLPAALKGIDIKKLIAGAKKQKKNFLNKNFEENPSFQLAAVQYLLSKKEKTINVMMPYSQKLFRLGDWYRQLLAESIGKKFDNNGKQIFAGITPINALGVTDQHSQAQLYNEGPNDKLIIFLEVKNFKNTLKIPNPFPKNPLYNFFNKNVTFNKILELEKKGTEQSLIKNHRPNITIKVDSVSEETLGELFMFLEGSIAFLGEFYNINAFDQPGVELSKNITKKLLAKEYGIT